MRSISNEDKNRRADELEHSSSPVSDTLRSFFSALIWYSIDSNIAENFSWRKSIRHFDISSLTNQY